MSDERVDLRVHFHLSPADVALPDGRVYEGVLVSVTGDEVSVWQACPPKGNEGDEFVLVWSGTRSPDDLDTPGTFTIPTIDGPLEVTWPRLLTASPGGEDR